MSLLGAYCLGLVIAGEAGSDLTPMETKIAVGMVYYRRAEFKHNRLCEVINKKWSSEYITRLNMGEYSYPDSKTILKNMIIAQKIINMDIKKITRVGLHIFMTPRSKIRGVLKR